VQLAGEPIYVLDRRAARDTVADGMAKGRAKRASDRLAVLRARPDFVSCTMRILDDHPVPSFDNATGKMEGKACLC
jgi:hypothetical protein